MSVQGAVEGELAKIPESPRPSISPEKKALLPKSEQKVVNTLRRDGGAHIDGNPKTGDPDKILRELANEIPSEQVPSPPSKSQQVLSGFSGFAQGAEKGIADKQQEYRGRIEAVLNGTPIKPEDAQSLKGLQRDYLTFGGQDFWSQVDASSSNQAAKPSEITKSQVKTESGTVSPEVTKTPYEQFLEDSNDTEMVGREIISSASIRTSKPGETYDQVKEEARTGGWLSALTNAKERPGDLQEIVSRAKASGVSKETLKTHLESLGIKVTEPEEKVASEQASPLDETRINGYLGEIAAQGRLAIKGILKPEEVQRMVDEAKAAGVPLDQIETTLRGVGIGINKGSEVAVAGARLAQPQENQSKQSPIESQLGDNRDNIDQEQNYKDLENVRKAREKLLSNMKTKDFNWTNYKGTVQTILYGMLTRRSNADELLSARGGAAAIRESAEAKQYRALLEQTKQLDRSSGGDFEVVDAGAWWGINTRPEVGRREGNNIKTYVTLPVDQNSFVKDLPALAQLLRGVAVESDDVIQVKVPTSYGSYLDRNDSIVVHYKKPDNVARVAEALEDWKQQHNILEDSREMGRTKVGIDPKDTSFSDAVANHVTNWLQQNYGKYPTEVLADEAIKHAITLSQKPPQFKG